MEHRTVEELQKALTELDADIEKAEDALDALREQRATVLSRLQVKEMSHG